VKKNFFLFVPHLISLQSILKKSTVIFMAEGNEKTFFAQPGKQAFSETVVKFLESFQGIVPIPIKKG
jgi:hypothetical protein